MLPPTFRMMLEYGVVLMMIIAFLISLCSFMHKLRIHYETEQTKVQQNAAASTVTSGQTNYTIDTIEGGVFAKNLDPPPYSERDLPPKYDDVMKVNIDLPKVHNPTVLSDIKTIA